MRKSMKTAITERSALRYDKQLANGDNVVCDIDVVGAQNIKKNIWWPRIQPFHKNHPQLTPYANGLKIAAPTRRKSSSNASTVQNLNSQAPNFDACIVNDVLQKAQEEAANAIRQYLETAAE